MEFNCNLRDEVTIRINYHDGERTLLGRCIATMVPNHIDRVMFLFKIIDDTGFDQPLHSFSYEEKLIKQWKRDPKYSSVLTKEYTTKGTYLWSHSIDHIICDLTINDSLKRVLRDIKQEIHN